MTLEHRIDGGGERTVVLSGSLGTTFEMWEHQLPALTSQFTVLRYHHPGHGASPLPEERDIGAFARDLVRLLDHLRLERVSFCGVSLGGAVGMQLALGAPDRLDRLVLASASARFATAPFWEERAATVRALGVEALAAAVLERWFTPGFDDVRRYRQMLVSTPAEGYARCCEALRDWDVRDALAAIRTPTSAVWTIRRRPWISFRPSQRSSRARSCSCSTTHATSRTSSGRRSSTRQCSPTSTHE
jgi:3-oxoadipate enol-lactonase